jgi:hypothetical protein
MGKNLQLKKNFIFFQKLEFTYPKASRKDVQDIEEAFSPHKKISITSKHEISFFSTFVRYFAILDPDPDTDPLT